MSAIQVSPLSRVIPDSDLENTEITDLDSTEEELPLVRCVNPAKETDGKHAKHASASKGELIFHADSFLQSVGKELESQLKHGGLNRDDLLARVGNDIDRFLSGKPPTTEAVIEPDSTYYVSKEEVKEARKCAGRAIRLSPETAMMMFDILWFSTYAIGWIITLIFNYDAVTDNAVTRVTGKYNICIGVDSYPARYVSIPMSYLFTIVFGLTCVLFMKRMLDQRKWSTRCSKVWRTGLMSLAFMLFLCYSWTIGVMPVDAPTFRMHLMGFLLALAGYAMIKLVSVIEFGYFAEYDDGEKGLSCIDMCRTWRKFIFLTFEIACCLVLAISCTYLSTKYWEVLYSWPIEKVEMILNSTVPTDTQPSYNTMPVLFFTAVCPIVVRIIDPRRRHITITFKYNKPGDDPDEDSASECLEKCLETRMPCSCCFKEEDDSLIQSV